MERELGGLWLNENQEMVQLRQILDNKQALVYNIQTEKFEVANLLSLKVFNVVPLKKRDLVNEFSKRPRDDIINDIDNNNNNNEDDDESDTIVEVDVLFFDESDESVSKEAKLIQFDHNTNEVRIKMTKTNDIKETKVDNIAVDLSKVLPYIAITKIIHASRSDYQSILKLGKLNKMLNMLTNTDQIWFDLLRRDYFMSLLRYSTSDKENIDLHESIKNVLDYYSDNNHRGKRYFKRFYELLYKLRYNKTIYKTVIMEKDTEIILPMYKYEAAIVDHVCHSGSYNYIIFKDSRKLEKREYRIYKIPDNLDMYDTLLHKNYQYQILQDLAIQDIELCDYDNTGQVLLLKYSGIYELAFLNNNSKKFTLSITSNYSEVTTSVIMSKYNIYFEKRNFYFDKETFKKHNTNLFTFEGIIEPNLVIFRDATYSIVATLSESQAKFTKYDAQRNFKKLQKYKDRMATVRLNRFNIPDMMFSQSKICMLSSTLTKNKIIYKELSKDNFEIVSEPLIGCHHCDNPQIKKVAQCSECLQKFCSNSCGNHHIDTKH